MGVYSIIQKSSRPIPDLIKQYPSVAKVAAVTGAGLHSSFADPSTLYSPTTASIFDPTDLFTMQNSMPLDSLQMKAELGMKLSRTETTLIGQQKEKELERERELEREFTETGNEPEDKISESKSVSLPDIASPVTSPRVDQLSSSPSEVTRRLFKKTGTRRFNISDEAADDGAPRGHIFVEKGEKSFTFFVRCTTRKHTTEQFQELVGEMHNLALFFPFIDWEMSFLDPGGKYFVIS